MTVERRLRWEEGGGKGEKGGGREVERAAGTAEEKKRSARMDEYLCSLPTGYGREIRTKKKGRLDHTRGTCRTNTQWGSRISQQALGAQP